MTWTQAEQKAMGKRIRVCLAEREWTQSDLARESSMTHQYVSLILQGKADITTSKLVQIARVLKLSLDWLVTGEGNKESTAH